MKETDKEVRVFHRMDTDTYKALERQLVPPAINSSMTDAQVAYALGVQAVLKVLRDGFVLGQ